MLDPVPIRRDGIFIYVILITIASCHQINSYETDSPHLSELYYAFNFRPRQKRILTARSKK